MEWADLRKRTGNLRIVIQTAQYSPALERQLIFPCEYSDAEDSCAPPDQDFAVHARSPP